MSTVNAVRKKTAGKILGMAGCLLAAAGLISYLVYMNVSGDTNPLVLAGLSAAIAAELVLLKMNADGLAILPPVLTAAALCAFLIDSVETFVGYFMNLAMFGDASLISYIFCTCFLAGAAMVAFLVDAFVRK